MEDSHNSLIGNSRRSTFLEDLGSGKTLLGWQVGVLRKASYDTVAAGVVGWTRCIDKWTPSVTPRVKRI